MVDKKVIEKAVSQVLSESKGKRKFTQSVDMALNFNVDVDFKKAENRLNVDVLLPNPPKQQKVAVFADGQLALEAKNAGADMVISGADIPKIAGDKAQINKILECAILSAPQLIAQVGKAFGQALAGKGKSPKPIVPNADVKDTVKRARTTISIRSRGKYLPTVHCIIGREDMDSALIADNVLAVLEAIEKKIPEQKMASMFIKTTMGKPVRITLGV
jgi:large subunit ribosomal protein L1